MLWLPAPLLEVSFLGASSVEIVLRLPAPLFEVSVLGASSVGIGAPASSSTIKG